jgi:hypothetical protein
MHAYPVLTHSPAYTEQLYSIEFSRKDQDRLIFHDTVIVKSHRQSLILCICHYFSK